ncbi:helix-turn-helix transcriptional regulator [Aceticella autotrophica]|uniref:Helix-turn-helix transcriptional regulator n=1 Tax=Aceticella autotrophica TaxID=2755338 RepID=A0A975GAQ2_9THEO|nr:metalloregulator ArsR/SmtB family transcription factor [Aceticella autotrophica]QSZ27312.1 helix-turn-helix transcriptional regulator [Aceticella autotrophica]
MNQDDLIVKIFKALGHPVRFKIMKFLCDGPKCVCKLNERFEYSQANLSQHLRILKDAGLVKSEKVGLEMHYRLYNENVKKIIKCVRGYVLDYVNSLKDNPPD